MQADRTALPRKTGAGMWINTSIIRHKLFVLVKGLEPSTFALQERCATIAPHQHLVPPRGFEPRTY